MNFGGITTQHLRVGPQTTTSMVMSKAGMEGDRQIQQVPTLIPGYYVTQGQGGPVPHAHSRGHFQNQKLEGLI